MHTNAHAHVSISKTSIYCACTYPPTQAQKMRQKQNLMDAETQCLIFGRSLLLHFFSLAHQHYTTRHLVTPDHIFLLNAVRASRKRVRARPKKPKDFWRGRGESAWTFRASMYILRQLRGACRRGSSNPPEQAIILIASFWDFHMSKNGCFGGYFVSNQHTLRNVLPGQEC